VDVPDVPAYVAIDVDLGAESRNVRPEDALRSILDAGRSPLTLEEGIALVLQQPEVIARNLGLLDGRIAARRPARTGILDQRGPTEARLVLGPQSPHLARDGLLRTTRRVCLTAGQLAAPQLVLTVRLGGLNFDDESRIGGAFLRGHPFDNGVDQRLDHRQHVLQMGRGFAVYGGRDAVKSDRDALAGGAYGRSALDALQWERFTQGVGHHLYSIRGRIRGFQAYPYIEKS
jgi:hypothetical protein